MAATTARQRTIGTQLPIQAQSTMFASPWEAGARPGDLLRVAQACDAVGYDYIGVCDHVVIPRAAAPTMGTQWMDPISTLSWIAGQTERVGLLTHVFVLGYRHPLVAAKQFATLDHLSGGRLIAGIGAGHLQGEFEALGVDFAARGRDLDAALPTLIAALENEFVDDLGAQPRPEQQPRPPIWVAGSSAPALRRAARFGDGWLPQGPASVEHVDALHQLLDGEGRSSEGFVIGHIARPVHIGRPEWDAGRRTITGTANEVTERLLSTVPDGVNQIQLAVAARDLDECCDQLAVVAAEVVPALRSI
ncbi:MAG: TIGR03619 family F420-dependent LLM class oxidoreductase [Acidimicrobiia bacterium]|nr:TIGR03619 family F420-dependent LLM class oxidoreductase [Acidimicrobiia bacterium]